MDTGPTWCGSGQQKLSAYPQPTQIQATTVPYCISIVLTDYPLPVRSKLERTNQWSSDKKTHNNRGLITYFVQTRLLYILRFKVSTCKPHIDDG